ncbi:MAG: isoaspartyl peptidase/L-asparaginase, partial [Pigmentiphaga sp.]
ARREEPSPRALERHAQLLAALSSGSEKPENSALRGHWIFSMPWDEAIRTFGSGTVGAVALDTQGRFAVAASTGGCPPSLLGRVGDTPIIGCGFFAGPAGAVAVTGVGEYIVPRLLARSIYEEALSRSMEQAIEAAIADFPPDIDLGIIGLSVTEIVMRSNRDMPCAAVRR